MYTKLRQNLRIIFLIVASLSISNLAATPSAFADFNGCPNTWSIEKNSPEGIEQLNKAKIALDFKMSLKFLGNKYSSFSGELGSLPEPKSGIPNGPLITRFYYLFGKTISTASYEVAVQNCPEIMIFEIQNGQINRKYTTFEFVDLKNWTQSNPNLFVDFKAANEFPNLVENYVKAIQTRAQQERYFNLMIPNPNFLGLKTSFSIQYLSSGCLETDTMAGASELRLLRSGQKCEIGIATAIGTENTEKIYILKKFILETPKPSVTITCIKGKVSKKFTGQNPSCPAGFKKKK